MKPSFEFIVQPLSDGQNNHVSLTVSVTDNEGKDHDVILYQSICPVRELMPDEAMEYWCLDIINKELHLAAMFLFKRLEQRQRTTMLETFEQQRHLCIGSWTGNLRPARMSPVGTPAMVPTGFRLWVPPRKA